MNKFTLAEPKMAVAEDTDYKLGPSARLMFYDYFRKHFKTRIGIDIGLIIPSPCIVDEKLNTPQEDRFYFDEVTLTITKKDKNRILSISPIEFNYITDMVMARLSTFIKTNFNLIDVRKIIMYDRNDVKTVEDIFITYDEIVIGTSITNNGYFQVSIYSSYEDTEIFSNLIKFLRQFRKSAVDNSNTINIIKHTQRGFDFFTRPIKDYSTDFSINHYNTDFVPISEKIVNSINTESAKGLVLLYGGVGTGKTSYIKHLISASKRKVFYIPPDMAQSLSNPDFIEFMATTLADSILIIEDAENVLKPRGAGETQAVSNILNISDGILGDAVSSIIVCTFNDKIENVDQALLRPGRLVASYEFKHLALDKTNQLLQKLYDNKYEALQPMTLAEIFNQESMPMNNSVKKRAVGFTS